MDGTFKKCPSIFAQMYSIHFSLGSKVVTGAYCFLPDKSKETYLRMFNLLIDKSNLLCKTPFNPPAISCDFESGLISAIKQKFPNCEIRGCLFHLNQNVFRKIQSLGLLTFYNNDEFEKSIRRLNALPLLPIYKIDNAFDLLCHDILDNFENAAEIEKINALLSYYYETYIKEDSPFAIPKKYWNQYRNSRRTNNDVEGFHNKFDHLFLINHPNFYNVIQEIKKIQTECEILIKNFKDRGCYEKKKNDIYSRINEELNDLWNSLDEDEISCLDFLAAAQHLLSKKK